MSDEADDSTEPAPPASAILKPGAKVPYWSHTRHAMALKCGEQYRRRYVEGEVLPPGIAMLRGRNVHQIAEENLSRKMETGALIGVDELADRITDVVKGSLAAPWVLDGHYAELKPNEAKVVLATETRELATFHGRAIAPTIDPTHVEVRVEVAPSEDLPVTFVSVLDVVDRGRIIRDLKTKTKAPTKDEADRSEQLSGQTLALTALEGKPPERSQLDFIVRTPGGKIYHAPQPTTRTDADLEVFYARARRAIEGIEREVFLPAAEGTWWCSDRWCGYARTCPYYRGRNRPTS